ncbi:MAG TPA: exonuclease [Thermodesulfobacteriaceae bacterium]|nr:exonuclease [Thermodesulfobacteriaceae bacterium]
MLKNTFSHIPGVGPVTERRLWEAGICSWDDFRNNRSVPLPPAKAGSVQAYLEESLEHIGSYPGYFSGLLPDGQHWRLFPEFRHATVFLDIETTGLENRDDSITTIALYDGENTRYFVQGENLEDFPGVIGNYSVIVTYNGKCFDVPFIERYFGIRLDHAHIDLRYVLKGLGYGGGLKACERRLGIRREEVHEIDGFLAVALWDVYRRTRNRTVLETLLAYNLQDAVNLERLMVLSYNMCLKQTPFYLTHRLTVPQPPELPVKADRRVIEEILRISGPAFPSGR